VWPLGQIGIAIITAIEIPEPKELKPTVKIIKMVNEDYKVIVEKGMQLLTYKGELLPGQIDTKVEQELDAAQNGWAVVTVVLRSKLADTK
jgi:hypothetical protein